MPSWICQTQIPKAIRNIDGNWRELEPVQTAHEGQLDALSHTFFTIHGFLSN